VHLPIGAPLATIILEALIALGGNKIICCGIAGALKKEILFGAIVIPESAVRDEGTSYHYIGPDKKAVPHPEALSAIKKTCALKGVPYESGRTWTTDAVFRETKHKIDERKKQGCVAVEMEASALFAVAEFRKAAFAQILYVSDNVTEDEWSIPKGKEPAMAQEDAFWLAVESCAGL
jgi:uridine phosphorylase